MRGSQVLVDTDEMNQLAEEYRKLQVAPDRTLPKYVKRVTRIDQFGGKSSMDLKLYILLTKAALAMTTILNSNADCERTFSMVKKIQTDRISDKENDSMRFIGMQVE